MEGTHGPRRWVTCLILKTIESSLSHFIKKDRKVSIGKLYLFLAAAWKTAIWASRFQSSHFCQVRVQQNAPWSVCFVLVVSFWSLPVSFLLLQVSWSQNFLARPLSWKVPRLLVAQHRKIWPPHVHWDSTKHMQNAWEAPIVIWWFWSQTTMIPKPIAPIQVVGLKPPSIIHITVHASPVLVRVRPYFLTPPKRSW